VVDGAAPTTLTKNGPGTWTLGGANRISGTAAVNAGLLRLAGAGGSIGGMSVAGGATLEAAANHTLASLTVNDGAVTKVTGGVLKVGDNTQTTPLSLSGSAKVDMVKGAMAVDVPAGSETSTLQSVRGLIVQGFNNGDWGGNGITSSAAAADRGKAVGYALGNEVKLDADGKYLGQTVDASSVIVRYTLAGDATLDGAVDFNDLVKLAQNYNTTVSTSTDSWWTHGDFTYDGITDFNDLVKLAQNYNTALPSEAIPGAPVNFEADLARAFAQAPEPSALALATIAACGFAIKRRRRATW
jgi:fibronectin-binding autotransporter adhesin